MIAYKAFEPGLTCRNYQFVMGRNTTDEANCAKNGFHCAENPLDCLSYYSDLNGSEYYLVNAQGDIDEDNHDTKIACTELFIIKKLTLEDFFLHALAYMVDHPFRSLSAHVIKDYAKATRGYAVIRGIDPVGAGNSGDILAFVKEDLNRRITQVALTRVDGKKILPNTYYDIDLTERLAKL